MMKFFGNAQDSAGNAILGASVSVKDHATGNAATIYQDDESTPLANPLTTDSVGRWEFRASDGEYDITVASGTYSATFNRVVLASGTGSAAKQTADLSAQAKIAQHEFRANAHPQYVLRDEATQLAMAYAIRGNARHLHDLNAHPQYSTADQALMASRWFN